MRHAMRHPTRHSASTFGGVRILIVTSALLFAMALAGGNAWAAATAPATYTTAYAQASKVVGKALDMNAGWTITGETLDRAEKAAKAGRYDEATQLARRAAALARLSIAQAGKQQTAWHAAVVR